MKFLINLVSNTIGKLSLPFVDKKFNLRDYFKIEKELSKLDVPFAIAIVTTYGHGSNLLIRFTNFLSKDKRKRKSRKTHALAIVETKNGKFRAVESIGKGVQEVTLLSAIGQRDEVKIRIPDKRYINDMVATFALGYINEVARRDEVKNIAYDSDHDLLNSDRYNCSELIFHALEHGYKRSGQASMIKIVERAGKKTWSPVDAEFSKLFRDLYDSKK